MSDDQTTTPTTTPAPVQDQAHERDAIADDAADRIRDARDSHQRDDQAVDDGQMVDDAADDDPGDDDPGDDDPEEGADDE